MTDTPNGVVAMHIHVETERGEHWRITPHIRNKELNDVAYLSIGYEREDRFDRVGLEDVLLALQRRMEVTIKTPFGLTYDLVAPPRPELRLVPKGQDGDRVLMVGDTELLEVTATPGGNVEVRELDGRVVWGHHT